MRVNKLVVLLTIMVMLTPALSVLGVENNFQDQTSVTPSSVFNAPVGVEAGDLIYWTINQLDMPDAAGITDFPDFSGNQLYMKIQDVFNYEVAPGVDDNIIYFALGMKFISDFGFTVGTSPLETEFIIPAGSVTPSVGLYAVPHMNGTYGYGPIMVVLNQAWNDHEALFEDMLFTVNNDVDDFEVTATNGTGTISGTWRKSDGVLTHLLMDDIWWMGLNFTGGTVELTYDSMENNPLPVTVGDNIEFTLDTMQVDVSGSGDLWDGVNETILNEEIGEIEALQGLTVEKLVVEHVYGTFYGCGVYVYDTNTEQLVKIPDLVVIFQGFQGCYQIAEPMQFPTGPDYTFIGGIMAPWITPDWGIYGGQAQLYNTFMGVYLADIVQLIGYNPEDMVVHSAAGGFELETKKGFYYFYESMQFEIEENLTYSTIITIMGLNDIYEEGFKQSLAQEGYISYTETGICASLHVKAEVDMEYYDALNATADGTGTMRYEIEVKIRNVDYDPPELIKGGIIPGFTWMAAFPALLGIAVIGVIIRKRK
ncbi:MAG: hypothetical protein FK733_19475 [Asgard group archaeon]|nr:hypothetical protein [Asgard group archaeon]